MRGPQRAVVAPQRVVQAVCDKYGHTPDDITSRSRKQPLATHRQMIAYILRVELGLSLHHIGEVIARDHSTIVHSVTAYRRALLTTPGLSGEYTAVVDDLVGDQGLGLAV